MIIMIGQCIYISPPTRADDVLSLILRLTDELIFDDNGCSTDDRTSAIIFVNEM